MPLKTKNSAFKANVASLMSKIVSVIGPLILVPIFVKYLTIEEYGIWLIVLSIMSFFYLTNVCILQVVTNAIAKDTRRGKGNVIITSSDVASALQMAGVLDYAPALDSNSLSPDDTGNTFVGVLNGRYRVYIDPYAIASSTNWFVVGYKGSSAYDAGIFYCPYVPLQMVRAVDTSTFQPKIGFKTRYGMVRNPFALGATAPGSAGGADIGGDNVTAGRSNVYYRLVHVANLM